MCCIGEREAHRSVDGGGDEEEEVNEASERRRTPRRGWEGRGEGDEEEEFEEAEFGVGKRTGACLFPCAYVVFYGVVQIPGDYNVHVRGQSFCVNQAK